MPDRKELLTDFYKKYAPDQELTEERLTAINKKYGDNDEQLLTDFYSKYAPDQELSPERLTAIYDRYGLKKKESSIPPTGQSFGLPAETSLKPVPPTVSDPPSTGKIKSEPNLPLFNPSTFKVKEQGKVQDAIPPETAEIIEPKPEEQQPIPGYKPNPKSSIDHLRNINALSQQGVKATQERIGILKGIKESEAQAADLTKQLESLKQVIDNPGESVENKNSAVAQYNELLTAGKSLQDQANKNIERYGQLVRHQGTLNAAAQVTERLRQGKVKSEFSNWQHLVDNTLKNSMDAMAGLHEFLNNLPLADPLDPAMGIMTADVQKEIDKKVTGDLKKIGESFISQEIPKSFQESIFKGKFDKDKLGYFVVNAVSSTAPTIAAGLVTGWLGATAAGTGLMYNESYSMFKEAGMSDEDAATAATGIAIPLGLLEAWGVSDIIKSIGGKKVLTESIAAAIPKLTAKTLTKEEIFATARKTVGQKIKDFSADLAKTSYKEPPTEMEQGLVSEGGKQAAEGYTGQDSNANQSTGEYLAETGLKVAEEGLGGLFGGVAFGSIGAGVQAFNNPSTYKLAMDLKAPEKMEEFNQALQHEIQTGKLTQEQADIALQNVQKIHDIDAKIPATIEDTEARSQAVELIDEKESLKAEIEGKDEALSAPIKEQIKEIDNGLGEIANGKKLYQGSDFISETGLQPGFYTPEEVEEARGSANLPITKQLITDLPKMFEAKEIESLKANVTAVDVEGFLRNMEKKGLIQIEC